MYLWIFFYLVLEDHDNDNEQRGDLSEDEVKEDLKDDEDNPIEKRRVEQDAVPILKSIILIHESD